MKKRKKQMNLFYLPALILLLLFVAYPLCNAFIFRLQSGMDIQQQKHLLELKIMFV